MSAKSIRICISIVFITFLIDSCSNNYTPKPLGYLRFDPPPPSYTPLVLNELPYKFMISQYASVEMPPQDSAEFWINIDYQKFNAIIYCSYQGITPHSLPEYADECRKLVSRTVKHAVAINESVYEKDKGKVYGTLFEIEGETASPIQFMLTDSISNFFRGALYFRCEPNTDSLAPYIDYLRKDVMELIQSFEWK
ncbi:MAG: gliding motility protein GldD [Tannerella sp.]|nr:gliding motility protein GldD [Tannerella sp.]